MGYIEELRLRVGSAPLIIVGAGVLLFDGQGRLLLLRRADNGLWGLPGGVMELGESLEDTARRETREGTGLPAADLTLFGVFSGPELHYRYPNGDEIHNVTVVYVARWPERAVEVQPREHTESAFFDVHTLPADISPPQRPVLRELLRRMGSVRGAEQ